MLFQCRASVEDCGSTLKHHWVKATGLRKVYSRPSDGLVLGQRLRRLTGFDPAMGCDAGPTLNRNLVGKASQQTRYIHPMLGYCDVLRRRPSINLALVQCIMFAGPHPLYEIH